MQGNTSSISLNERDFLRKESYYKLIEEQFMKNLPYVLSMVEDLDGNLHHFDGLSFSRRYKKNKLNPISEKEVLKIFYFFLTGKNDIFEYLGHSKEKNERKVFLNRYLRAVNDDAISQFNVAVSYNYGNRGVPINHELASYWYSLSACHGNIAAQNNLGFNYLNGQGVTQDYQKAIFWIRLAAKSDDQHAQYNLGVCYEQGLGVVRYIEEARKWYTLSANQGYDLAKQALAELTQLET